MTMILDGGALRYGPGRADVVRGALPFTRILSVDDKRGVAWLKREDGGEDLLLWVPGKIGSTVQLWRGWLGPPI